MWIREESINEIFFSLHILYSFEFFESCKYIIYIKKTFFVVFFCKKSL